MTSQLVKELQSKEKQLSIIDSSIKFKNDNERLDYVSDSQNWKIIEQSNRFKYRISIFTLKHLRFIRYETLYDQLDWKTKTSTKKWMNSSTRKLSEDGTQSSDAYTNIQIAQVLKEERNNI